MNKVTKNRRETLDLGIEFAKTLKAGDVVLLYGDLGAGKTTFVQGVAKGLGIKDRILSPTFVLLRSHEVIGSEIKTFNHVDLYRIDLPTEIKNLGIEEVVGKNSVTLIEWADRLPDFKHRGYKVWLKHLNGDKREIRVEMI